ncbi:hypothetical protein [Tolypothrix sp. PCC 7712]|nr:hypothetical protein [Tolypothrix sp. PCC 7712]
MGTGDWGLGTGDKEDEGDEGEIPITHQQTPNTNYENSVFRSKW